MPTFTHSLPERQKHMGFDLRRTPAERSIVAVVTCDQYLVTDTHYWGGRTVPHELDNCPACAAIMPKRTHVYVSAFDLKSREHFIFECTSNAAKSFEEHFSAHQTLRGCMFCAERPKRTKNGKVVISTRTCDLTKINLPSPPDLIRALCVIWQVPAGPVRQLEEPVRHLEPVSNTESLNRMRNQPDNVPEPVHVSDLLKGNGKLKRKDVPV